MFRVHASTAGGMGSIPSGELISYILHSEVGSRNKMIILDAKMRHRISGKIGDQLGDYVVVQVMDDGSCSGLTVSKHRVTLIRFLTDFENESVRICKWISLECERMRK